MFALNILEPQRHNLNLLSADIQDIENQMSDQRVCQELAYPGRHVVVRHFQNRCCHLASFFVLFHCSLLTT